MFNTDGTMSSNAVPDWVPVATFRNNYGPADFGFAPAYRVWPDGKVEWRGIVMGPLSGDGTPVLTIPAEARPDQASSGVGATSYHSTGAVMRIEFNNATNPGAVTAYAGGNSRTWVSLDCNYYYLT